VIHKQLRIGFETKAIKPMNNILYHPLKELKCKLCNIFNLLPWGGKVCEIDFKGTVKQI